MIGARSVEAWGGWVGGWVGSSCVVWREGEEVVVEEADDWGAG